MMFEAGTVVVIVHQIEPGARQRLFGAIPSGEPPDSFTEAGIKKLCSPFIAEVKQLAASVDISDAAKLEMNQQRYDRRLDILLKAAKA